ncbi:MAG: hypothetical protein J5647_00015 [Spirochaetaceae bacterium]|nr:hypothetical protein [Spirochaetaceae bacterium]
MRDYQPKKNNPYELDPDLYKLMLGFIRNADKFRKSVEDNIYIPGVDFLKVGTGNSVRAFDDSIIERQAIVIAEKNTVVKAVDKSLEIIPEEYRRYILDNIILNAPLHRCEFADPRTLRRHKSRFIYKLAHELCYI